MVTPTHHTPESLPTAELLSFIKMTITSTLEASRTLQTLIRTGNYIVNHISDPNNPNFGIQCCCEFLKLYTDSAVSVGNICVYRITRKTPIQ